MLVPARLLLNGASIVTETSARHITYYHVELDSHDILIAEGAPAVSHLVLGNRQNFDGAPDCALSLPPRWSSSKDSRLFASSPLIARIRPRLAAGRWVGTRAGIDRLPRRSSGPGRSAAQKPRVQPVRATAQGPARLARAALAPRHWWLAAPEGVTIESVGGGVESGLAFVDFRFVGQAKTAGCCAVHVEPGAAIAVEFGEDWTGSCYLLRRDKGFNGAPALSFCFDEYGANDETISTAAIMTFAPRPATIWRYSDFRQRAGRQPSASRA